MSLRFAAVPSAVGICFAVACALAPSAARAAPATEALSTCLVASTDAADRHVLVRWMFSAIGRHPDLSGAVSLTADQVTAMEREAGTLFQRLLVKDCLVETRAAFEEGREQAFGTAFETLGRTAGTELFANSKVEGATQGLLRHIDIDLLQRALGSPPQ